MKNELESPEQIAIVLFNSGMFRATGETDKPVIIIELTPEQRQRIHASCSRGMDILTIHPVEK